MYRNFEKEFVDIGPPKICKILKKYSTEQHFFTKSTMELPSQHKMEIFFKQSTEKTISSHVIHTGKKKYKITQQSLLYYIHMCIEREKRLIQYLNVGGNHLLSSIHGFLGFSSLCLCYSYFVYIEGALFFQQIAL
jgi:hypothetical protein